MMASSSIRSSRVVVIEPGYENYCTESEILSPFGATVEAVTWNGDENVIIDSVRRADAVLVRESPIGRRAIEAMECCRAVVRYGVGVDNIDLESAREKRIFVANVPDYGADEVSDHAVALLLAVARRVAKRDHDVRAGAWGVGQKEKVFALRGRTLGILGYGHIGRRFHRKMLGFGVARTLVCSPDLSKSDAEAADVVKVDLETLCAQSDLLSLHAPHTASTHHIVGRDELALMKPETIIVNTARGPLIDESALYDVLRSRAIFGAGLDVFEREPPAGDNPLFLLDNVVLSDHTGWYSESSVVELQTKAASEIARVFAGERPLSWMNPWSDDEQS